MGNRKSARIELFDLIKCLAIFAVIWGHTATNAELTGNPPLLYKVLYSFHMPLFFFVAGLSTPLRPLHGKRAWLTFFRKSILTLVFPYLMWGLVYCNFSFPNVARILYGSWQTLGAASTLSSLWFLCSFFMARIYVRLTVNLFERLALQSAEGIEGLGSHRVRYLAPAAVFLAIGAALPKLEMGYPWCMDNACIAAGFILMGMALKSKLIELSVQKEPVLAGGFVACTAAFVAVVALLGDSFEINLMCGSSYGALLPALVLALLGSGSAIFAACILKRLADEWVSHLSLGTLRYIGQHTMGIFLLHKPMMQQLFIPGLEQALGAACPEALIRFLGACIALVASLWLCRLIEHYVPELVGIFSKDLLTGTKETA